MDDAVKRMKEEFDNFMKRYREMDADEFVKELEATGIAFEKTDDDKNEIVDSSEAQNCSWFEFCDVFPKC